MTYTITDIFPSSFLKTNIERKLTMDEMDVAKEHSSENKYYKNAGNFASYDTEVINDVRLKEIYAFIKSGINSYINEIIVPKNKLDIYVTQSWFNYTNPGQFHHKHNHSNSLLSGVFYFNANPMEDKIHFIDDSYDFIQITPKEWNVRNCKTWWVAVETGTLIIFPSHLQHMVETTTSKETRISLAFNTFVRGDLGEPTTNNFLRL